VAKIYAFQFFSARKISAGGMNFKGLYLKSIKPIRERIGLMLNREARLL
jgi:hypothetical protein